MKNNFLRNIFLVIIFFLICYQIRTVVSFDNTKYGKITEQKISENIQKNIKYIKIAGQSIKVELVSTPEKRAQGLSGRIGLREDEGMFFIFSQLGNYPFWMKDMNFPIDIIWLNENMKVIYIKKDARPESYPETYGPDDVPTDVGIPTWVGTKYVLEVVSGFSEKNNLKEGDRVEFQ